MTKLHGQKPLKVSLRQFIIMKNWSSVSLVELEFEFFESGLSRRLFC